MFMLSILKLLLTLHLKFKKVNDAGMQSVFSKEFRTLCWFLAVFSISYLLRFLCDVVPLGMFPDDFILSMPPCPNVKQV